MRKFILIIPFLISFVFAFSQVTLDSELLEYYDVGTEQYIPIEMTEHQYDGNGNLTESISYSWNGSSWDESNKEAYSYDANNNRTNNTSSSWNSSTSLWDDEYKIDYTYNGSDQLTEFVAQDWDGSQWLNSSRIANVTYVDDEITGYSEYSWSGSWEETARGVINYNGLNLDYILYEDWDGSQWVSNERETYTINGSTGKIEQQLIEGWNGSSWDLGAKYEYVLDGSFNRTSYLDSYYGTAWDLNYSYINTFDSADLMSTIYHPFDDIVYDLGLEDFPYTDRILYNIESNSNGDISNRTTFSYSDDPLSVKDFNQIKLKVYPNPTSDYLHINIDNFDVNTSLELFNLMGKQVKASHLYSNRAIVDISNLAKGVYFLKIHSNGKVATKKIIKK